MVTSSHLDLSQHPTLCQWAQVANDVNEVKVTGSNLARDTLPRPGESPLCNQGAPWTLQPLWTSPRRPGSHHPDGAVMTMGPGEPELEHGSPSTPLCKQLKAVRSSCLPRGQGGGCLVLPPCAICKVFIVSLGKSQPPPPFTTVGSAERPACPHPTWHGTDI